MPMTEQEARESLLRTANSFHGKAKLTGVDLIMLDALLKGSTQEQWRTVGGTEAWIERAVVADERGVIAENMTLTDMCFIVGAHGAFGGLLALAREALDARDNTPAFQPSAKVGDTVWLTRHRIVEDDAHERNIGYEVLVEERKITSITWSGTRFTYMVSYNPEDDGLDQDDLEAARDLQKAILAERARVTNMKGRSMPDNFIRAREEDYR